MISCLSEEDGKYGNEDTTLLSMCGAQKHIHIEYRIIKRVKKDVCCLMLWQDCSFVPVEHCELKWKLRETAREEKERRMEQI